MIDFRSEIPMQPHAEIMGKVYERTIGAVIRVHGSQPCPNSCNPYDWNIPTKRMARAMAFWDAVRAFPERAMIGIIGQSILDNAMVRAVRNGGYEANIFFARHMALREFVQHADPYLSAIAALESLPTPVVRRVLWFANIDFQSRESFLRRLTMEQLAVLVEHALIFDEARLVFHPPEYPKPELPCFRSGWVNAIAESFHPEKHTRWDATKPLGCEDERYASKAAIAVNVFGWDLGFKLYHDDVNDVPNSTTLAGQVLLSSEGEEFSVNTESRGAYAWLYQTLRSNPLWNEHAEIRLRPHVCPGFWATLSVWAVVAIVSPLAFFMLLATGLSGGLPDNSTSVYLFAPFWAFAALASVTPVLASAFALRWSLGKLSKEFDADFLKALFAVIASSVVVVGVGHGLWLAYQWADWSEPVNWLISGWIAVWLAYSIAKDKGKNPFAVPFFGPAFATALASRIVYLSWQGYPNELLAFGVFVIAVVLVLSFLVFLVMTRIWLVERYAKWCQTRTERFSELVKHGHRNEARALADESISFAHEHAALAVSAIVVIVLLLTVSMKGDARIGAIMTLVLIASALPIVVAASVLEGFFRNRERLGVRGMELAYVQNAYAGHRFSNYLPDILENPFLHLGYCQLNQSALDQFYEEGSRKLWNYFHQDAIREMFRSMTEEGVKRFATAKTKTYLLPYVLQGLTYSQARAIYRQELQSEKAENERKRALAESRRKGAQAFAQGFDESVKTFLTPFRLAGKAFVLGIRMLFVLKDAFDRICPSIAHSRKVC